MQRIIIGIVSVFCLVSGILGKTVRVPEEFTTIQQGIDSVTSGDTVLVGDGIYTGSGNRDLSFYSRHIVLRSENGPEATIIDCAGSKDVNHRAFYFFSHEDTACSVEGFTIQNGYAGFKGGAILIEDSSPKIENCIFKNNFGHHGGVMYITFDAFPIVRNCRFFDNATGDVGIIHARFGSKAVFSDCEFSGNTAKNGIFLCYNASPRVSNCTFRDNETEATGGAVFLQDDSSPSFTDCRFINNRCGGRGGAIFVEERGVWQNISQPVFHNCLIAGNVADTGGALYSSGPVGAVFENCIISGNTASAGCGIFSGNNEGTAISLTTSIVYQNSGSEAIAGDSSAFNISCSDIYGNAGGDWTSNIVQQKDSAANFSVNPGFVDAAQLDFDLKQDSPCRAENSPCNKTIGIY